MTREEMKRFSKLIKDVEKKASKKFRAFFESEDVAQTTALVALQIKIDSKMSEKQTIKYLNRRLYGGVVDVFRKEISGLRNRKPVVPVRFSELVSNTESTENSALEKALSRYDDGDKFPLEEERAALRTTIKSLCWRDIKVYALYFIGGCTMKETGRSLGLSESRISQIVKEITVCARRSFAK